VNSPALARALQGYAEDWADSRGLRVWTEALDREKRAIESWPCSLGALQGLLCASRAAVTADLYVRPRAPQKQDLLTVLELLQEKKKEANRIRTAFDRLLAINDEDDGEQQKLGYLDRGEVASWKHQKTVGEILGMKLSKLRMATLFRTFWPLSAT
jgi:hypothetical protein